MDWGAVASASAGVVAGAGALYELLFLSRSLGRIREGVGGSIVQDARGVQVDGDIRILKGLVVFG